MKDPNTARIVLFTAFVVMYALVRFVRWYQARPKVEKEEPIVGSAGAAATSSEVPEAAPKAPVQPAVEEAPPEPPSAPVAPMADGMPPLKDFSDLFTAEEIAQMEPMGKGAFGAGWFVEAHFWLTLARAHGVRGLSARLSRMEADWQAMGCPDEMENVHEGYTPEHAEIALAYMLFKCGVDQPANASFILDRMMGGSRTARVLALYEKFVEQ